MENTREIRMEEEEMRKQEYLEMGVPNRYVDSRRKNQ